MSPKPFTDGADRFESFQMLHCGQLAEHKDTGILQTFFNATERAQGRVDSLIANGHVLRYPCWPDVAYRCPEVGYWKSRSDRVYDTNTSKQRIWASAITAKGYSKMAAK